MGAAELQLGTRKAARLGTRVVASRDLSCRDVLVRWMMLEIRAECSVLAREQAR